MEAHPKPVVVKKVKLNSESFIGKIKVESSIMEEEKEDFLSFNLSEQYENKNFIEECLELLSYEGSPIMTEFLW